MTTKIQIIIYLIFFGIACASVYAYYNGKVLGDLIRKLDKMQKYDADNTASLEDLGYSKLSAFIISLSLGENSSLRKYVRAEFSAEEMEIYREKKLPQRYYLPRETSQIALKRYSGEKMSFSKLVLGIVACIAAAVISINVFPYLISMFSGVGDSFGNGNEVVGERIEETMVKDDLENR